MSKINELGDTGDRMMQGLPYGQGGAITGASNVDTYENWYNTYKVSYRLMYIL